MAISASLDLKARLAELESGSREALLPVWRDVMKRPVPRRISREMLVRIMTVPRNSIYRQFREILQGEGVELTIAPLVFEQIAELAIEYKVGARSLRGIFEEMLTPVLYVVPDDKRIAKATIASLFEQAHFFDAQGSPIS